MPASSSEKPSFAKSSFEKPELIACAKGEMFGPGNAQLPIDNMLMIDRIRHISDSGGDYGKGIIEAELDIAPELWFFSVSFYRRPRYARLSRLGRHVATSRFLPRLAG